MLPRVWQSIARLPEGEPHPDVPGFRRLPQGAVSGGIDPFAGISAPDADRITASPMPARGPALCAALFRGGIAPGTVPVAFFTDINCPYCRAMEPWIDALDPGKVSVTWHDLPLLGATSLIAARAVAAAQLQGNEGAMRARLNRARIVPDPGYLRRLAEGLSMDPDRLLADMDSPSVTARIAQTIGLANGFGIPGTPALVVGDLLAIGQRSETEVNRLIADAADRLDRLPCK